MSDLTDKEQRHVRTALRFLRLRVGGWVPLAAALEVRPDTMEKIVSGRRTATAGLAIRIARLVEVSVDDLLGGHWLSPRTCPHCGHPPDDFTDAETIVEEKARRTLLTLLQGGKP